MKLIKTLDNGIENLDKTLEKLSKENPIANLTIELFLIRQTLADVLKGLNNEVDEVVIDNYQIKEGEEVKRRFWNKKKPKDIPTFKLK